MDYDLRDWFKVDDQHGPICREERQYSLFLSNAISYKNRDILKKVFECNLEDAEKIQIKEVYYEPTFMRDYFYWDRTTNKLKQNDMIKNIINWPECFNKKLLKYVDFKQEEIDAINAEFSNQYEQLKNSEKQNKKWEITYYENIGIIPNEAVKKLDIEDTIKNKLLDAKQMMKAKPDIAVLYKKSNTSPFFLRLIECKYLSPESFYYNAKGEKTVSQTKAQIKILDFLCQNLSGEIKNGEVKIVKFFNKINNSKKKEISIDINKLLASKRGWTS